MNNLKTSLLAASKALGAVVATTILLCLFVAARYAYLVWIAGKHEPLWGTPLENFLIIAGMDVSLIAIQAGILLSGCIISALPSLKAGLRPTWIVLGILSILDIVILIAYFPLLIHPLFWLGLPSILALAAIGIAVACNIRERHPTRFCTVSSHCAEP